MSLHSGVDLVPKRAPVREFLHGHRLHDGVRVAEAHGHLVAHVEAEDVAVLGAEGAETWRKMTKK